MENSRIYLAGLDLKNLDVLPPDAPDFIKVRVGGEKIEVPTADFHQRLKSYISEQGLDFAFKEANRQNAASFLDEKCSVSPKRVNPHRQEALKILSGDVDEDLTPEEALESLAFCALYRDEYNHGEYLAEAGDTYAKKLLQKMNRFSKDIFSAMKDSQNNGPLLTLLRSRKYTKRTSELVSELRKKDDVNQVNLAGETPLILAAKRHGDSSSSVVESLLQAPHIDVNKQDSSGNSALHYAVASQNQRTVALLLDDEGIDVNAQNIRGQIPLHISMNDEISELLREGSNESMRDGNHKTPHQVSEWLRQPTFSPIVQRVPFNSEGVAGKLLFGVFAAASIPIDIYSYQNHLRSFLKGELCTCWSCQSQRARVLPAV